MHCHRGRGVRSGFISSVISLFCSDTVRVLAADIEELPTRVVSFIFLFNLHHLTVYSGWGDSRFHQSSSLCLDEGHSEKDEVKDDSNANDDAKDRASMAFVLLTFVFVLGLIRVFVFLIFIFRKHRILLSIYVICQGLF